MMALRKRSKLDVSVTGKHIFVGGTDYDDRAYWAQIPGAIWEKKLKKWRYPASPFAAYRIQWIAGRVNQQIKKEKLFRELLDEMKLIRSAAHYCKREDAIDFAEQFRDEAFNTLTKPWAHQVVAAEFTRGRGFAYLAMDMGTGKTLVAINEIYHRDARLVLVVCPKSVIDVWVEELQKHKPSSRRRVLALYDGSSTKKAEQVKRFIEAAGPSVSIIICNYESFWRGDLGKTFLDQYFDIIVYDEIHKLKAAGSYVSRFAGRMVHKASFRLGLSGTPFPNGPQDSYGQYRALDAGVFGTSVSKFRRRYFVLNEYVDYPDIIGTRNEAQMDQLLGLTMFRVEKSDVMDLPDTLTVYRYFDMSSEQRKVYREMENEFVAFVNQERCTATNALTRIVRLQQITSGFIKTETGEERKIGNEKEKALKDILENEIPRRDPVVVFCKFTKDLRSVEKLALDLGLRYKELSGARKELERGQYPNRCDVLGVQVQSGGLGVNLVKSAYCIFYSLGYSLAEYLQCKDRLHRGGQSRHVLYIHLLARGTIDELVHEAIMEKKEIVDDILEKIRKTTEQ